MHPTAATDLGHRPARFSRYIDQAGEGDLHALLADGAALGRRIDLGRFAVRVGHAYAPGKWTAGGVLQHIVDTERIFAYRALRIARGDRTPLPGFDENDFAAAAARALRPADDLLREFAAVRAASCALFAGLDRPALLARGSCSGIEIGAAALGFAIVGHCRHHLAVLAERYLAG